MAQAFGATQTLAQSQVEMNLRFPGQYWDAESGSHYNLRRNYLIHIGRYSKEDPLGLMGGLNKYSYVNQNPIYLYDDKGERSFIGIANIIRIIFGSKSRSESQNPPSPIPFPTPPIPVPEPIPTPPKSTPKDFEHNPGRDCDGNCNQCNPSEGTICFKGPHKESHGGLNNHYHLWKMGQDPNCICRWQSLGGRVGVGVVGALPSGLLECPFDVWGPMK